MRLSEFLRLAQVPTLSLHEAKQRRMFGPVYHGTTTSGLGLIEKEGFKVFEGGPRSGPILNGYEYQDYWEGIPPPIHHLGFGVYFSTVKAIAKQVGIVKGFYYLDIPRREIINWGVTKTMMKWWVANGYDPELAKTDRVAATRKLTRVLKSKWDAVWYKGKALKRLLDGDQVVVFDPSRIYLIDPKLSKPWEIGSKVRRKTDGMIGTILKVENVEGYYEENPLATWAKGAKLRLFVKWTRGGTEFNVTDLQVEPKL